MAEEKNEKDAGGNTCNQAKSHNQEQKEACPQERMKSVRSRLDHRPGYCTIPEWMERWALGD
jgi:hypothetical protein